MADPLILDANSLIVRCVMASVADEIAHDLPFTGGVYGSLSILSNLLDDHRIDAGRIIACFDHSPPPRRYRLIPGYKKKAALDGASAELAEVSYPFETYEQKVAAFGQIHAVKDALQTLGVECLCYEQREADDVIGAAARIFIERGERPLIVTSDRDMWQMVGWGARVWDLSNKELVDAGNFVSLTGVSTDTFLLYKALLGDPSDNIKGVHGMGKTKIPALFSRAHWNIRIVRDPRQQLGELCEFLGRLPKRTKAEARIIRERRRIEKVLQGIDLSSSFGPTDALTARLDAKPVVDWKAFCRVCKAAGLSSILGGHTRYTRPFERAAKNVR